MPSSNDVIEIPPSDSDTPKPMRKPKSSEVIEISSDDDPPAVSKRSKSKSTSKSARESKTPSGKPKADDGPPSTLRINPQKSKSDPAHKARHSISGRVEGLKIEDEDIIIIHDSDDDVGNGKAKASVRALPRSTPFRRSASSPTMNHGDDDEVMRDPPPEPVSRPKSRPQTDAGNSASTLNSKAAATSAPNVVKPIQHVAKSSDLQRGISATATATANSNNSNPITDGKAMADSLKSTASSGQVSSVKLISDSLNRDVPSAKVKVDLRSTVPVVQDSVAGSRRSTSGTPYAPMGSNKDVAPVLLSAETTMFKKTVTPATVPAKDLERTNIDRNTMASTSRGVPSSSRPGDAANASAKILNAKVDANPSMTSSTQTRSDPAMQVKSHVVQMSTAAISGVSTQPLRVTSNSGGLGKKGDRPSLVQATSMGKREPSSSVLVSKTHDSSSQPKSGEIQPERERIFAVRQLSGMDMRVLKDVLPKDVSLDSAEKITSRAGSSLAPVKSVPASASTSASVSRVSLAPGASPPVEPPSEAPVPSTRSQVPSVHMSTAAVAEASVPAPAIQRLSAADILANTTPVSHPRSEAPNVPVHLPREYVPDLSSSFFRQSMPEVLPLPFSFLDVVGLTCINQELPASQPGATSLPTKRKPSMDPTVCYHLVWHYFCLILYHRETNRYLLSVVTCRLILHHPRNPVNPWQTSSPKLTSPIYPRRRAIEF